MHHYPCPYQVFFSFFFLLHVNTRANNRFLWKATLKISFSVWKQLPPHRPPRRNVIRTRSSRTPPLPHRPSVELWWFSVRRAVPSGLCFAGFFFSLSVPPLFRIPRRSAGFFADVSRKSSSVDSRRRRLTSTRTTRTNPRPSGGARQRPELERPVRTKPAGFRRKRPIRRSILKIRSEDLWRRDFR